jgi:outer membrane receptor protein involved in Fe transport
LGGSLFSAQNNIYNAQTFIAPLASMQYALSHSTELFAAFAPRMHDETMQAILATNPYVNLSALDSIQYPYEPVNIAVGLRSNGETPFNWEARLAYIRTNNDRIFRLIGSNEWDLDYENTYTVKGSVQGSWRISVENLVTAMITHQTSRVNSGGASVPYVPSVVANVGYSHIFAFPLTASVDLDVFGPWNVTLTNEGTSSMVALLNAHAEYKLFEHLAITGDLRNLLNQTYSMWDGYPAMKIFAAIGVTAAL